MRTITGTNVAIVVGAVLLLTSRLGVVLGAGPALAALALVGFVVLARLSPSLLQAGVMGRSSWSAQLIQPALASTA